MRPLSLFWRSIVDYEICQNPYVSPQTLFARIRLDRFAGRGWLIEQIDSFFRQHDRGYLLLESEDGLGKTTLLAHLVQKRSYIHLFVEQARGVDNVANGLRSLATQLIRDWQLQSWFADDVLPAVAVRPNFLQRLLYVAARRRDQTSPGTPIVLVVDGFDEAGTFPGQNTLGLPRMLPKGVYVVVARQPSVGTLTIDTPPTIIRIDANDPRNTRDMQLYLEQLQQSSTVGERLRAEGFTSEAQATIIERSKGSWMYLCFAVDQIERGELSAKDIATLPSGLPALYLDFWWRQREKQHGTDQAQQWQYSQPSHHRWQKAILPLLSTLCAVMEGVTAQTLVTLADIDMPLHEVHHLLQREWNTFVAHHPGDDPHYCLCDTSMRHFLDGRRMTAALPPGLNEDDHAFLNEMRDSLRRTHSRIADYYLERWGGMENLLPDIPIRTRNSSDDGYGLRHVVAHLAGAGRVDDVHQLLRLEWVTQLESDVEEPTSWFGRLDQTVRRWLGLMRVPSHQQHTLVWYTAREQEGDLADYLSDIVQAWQLAEQCEYHEWHTLSEEEATRLISEQIGLHCGYALINASVNSLAHNIPLPLLGALLEKEIWKPDQAIAYVRQTLQGKQQADAPAILARYLPEELAGDALAMVRAVRGEHERARALQGLVEHLPAPLISEALTAAREIHHPAWRAKALVGLIPYLANDTRVEVIDEAFEATQAVWHASARAEALIDLAPHLPEPLLRKAVEVAREIVDSDWRSKALVGIAPHLPQPLLHEALSMWEVWSGHWRLKALSQLAQADRLEDLGDVYRVVDIAKTIPNEEQRALALADISPHLPPFIHTIVLKAIWSFTHEQNKVIALEGIIPVLSERHVEEVWEVAEQMEQDESRVRLLVALLPYIPTDEESRNTLIDQVIESAQMLGEEQKRVAILTTLGKTLAILDQREKALAVIETITDRTKQTVALANLACASLSGWPPEILDKVLNQVPHLDDPDQRTDVLTKISPYLGPQSLQRALVEARAINDIYLRMRTLIAFSPYLSEPLLRQILTYAQGLNDEQDRVEILILLSHHLPETLAREAIEVVQEVERHTYYPVALKGVRSSLRESLAHTMMQSARMIVNEHDRASAFAEIGPYLSEYDRTELLNDVQHMQRDGHRFHVLKALIPYLSGTLLLQTLPMARGFRQAEHRSTILMMLATRLAKRGYWRQAFDAAWGIHTTNDRATTLVNIAHALPEPLQKEVLSAIRTVEQPDVRAKALATIAPLLSTEEQSVLLPDILSSALAARWSGDASPSEILTAIKTHDARLQALESIKLIDSPDDRARALVEIAPFLPEPVKYETLRLALGASRLVWGEFRAKLLVDLAPYMPKSLLRDMIEDIQSLDREEWRAMALIGVAPYLPHVLEGDMVKEPLAAARTIWDVKERIEKMIHMLPFLPESERLNVLTECITAARGIAHAMDRSESLEKLVPHVLPLPRETIYRFWCDTLHIAATRTREDILLDLQALIPVLRALGGKTLIGNVAQSLIEVGYWFS